MMDNTGKTISEKLRDLFKSMKSKSIPQKERDLGEVTSFSAERDAIPLKSDDLLRSVYGKVESEMHSLTGSQMTSEKVEFPLIILSKIPPLVNLEHVSHVTSTLKGKFALRKIESSDDSSMNQYELNAAKNIPINDISAKQSTVEEPQNIFSQSFSRYTWDITENAASTSASEINGSLKSEPENLNFFVSRDTIRDENKSNLIRQVNPLPATRNYHQNYNDVDFHSSDASSLIKNRSITTNYSPQYYHENKIRDISKYPFHRSSLIRSDINRKSPAQNEVGPVFYPQRARDIRKISNIVDSSESLQNRSYQPRSFSVSYVSSDEPPNGYFNANQPEFQPVYLYPDGSLSTRLPLPVLYTSPDSYGGEYSVAHSPNNFNFMQPIERNSKFRGHKHCYNKSHSLDRRRSRKHSSKDGKIARTNERKLIEGNCNHCYASLSNISTQILPDNYPGKEVVLNSYGNQTDRKEEQILKNVKTIKPDLKSLIMITTDGTQKNSYDNIEKNSPYIHEVGYTGKALTNQDNIADSEMLRSKIYESIFIPEAIRQEENENVRVMDNSGKLENSTSEASYTSSYVREINKNYNKMRASLRSNSNDSPRFRYLENVANPNEKLTKTAHRC